jgi:hypothetical protein
MRKGYRRDYALCGAGSKARRRDSAGRPVDSGASSMPTVSTKVTVWLSIMPPRSRSAHRCLVPIMGPQVSAVYLHMSVGYPTSAVVIIVTELGGKRRL